MGDSNGSSSSGGGSMLEWLIPAIGAGINSASRAYSQGTQTGSTSGAPYVGFGMPDSEFDRRTRHEDDFIVGKDGKKIYGTGEYTELDAMKYDPRFLLWQGSEGLGRVGTMLSRRAEQPFSLGDPIQGLPTYTGSFLSAPVGIRGTDPAMWNPRDELESSGMNTGDPFLSFTSQFKKSGADPGFASPKPERDVNAVDAMQSHPDMQSAKGALSMLGIDQDPETGRFSFGGKGMPGQEMFLGAQGGQHRIPGSEDRPFGGPAGQRTGSQTTAEGGLPGVIPDIRRRRASWQSA